MVTNLNSRKYNCNDPGAKIAEELRAVVDCAKLYAEMKSQNYVPDMSRYRKTDTVRL